MTRFNIYAPCVKRLESISLQRETGLRFGDNAASFISLAQAATVVPNLKKLAIDMERVENQEYIHWVTSFLSPALLDVELVYCDASGRFGLNSSMVLRLLGNMSSKCPSVRRLSFFPCEGADDYDSETNNQSLDTLASFRLQLSSFRDLRTLESSVLVLSPTILSALGELPHLEKLLLNGNGCEPRIVDLTLSDTSFPALRNLELCDFHWANLRYMSEFAPLLHRLTKLSMRLTYNGHICHYRWDADDERDWPFKLMRGIGKNAPLLTDLTVDFGSVNTCACMSSDWTVALQALPLKRLSLPNAEFDCDWSHFGSALPTLEIFQCNALSFNEISELTQGLPTLRLLELNLIDFDAFGEDGEYGDEEDDDEDDDEESDDNSNGKPTATRTSEKSTAAGFSGADLQLKAGYVGLPTTSQQI